MPFYLYRKPVADGAPYERIRTVSLAGYNAIYRGWVEKSCPIEQGWHLGEHDLVRLVGGEPAQHVLLIDLKPRSVDSIDLYELRDIYVYTHGDVEERRVAWNPLMLRLRELWCEKWPGTKAEERDALTASFSAPQRLYEGYIIEFLYLQGTSWNWGRSGQVNGVLLYDQARRYFFGQLAQLHPATAPDNRT